MSTYRGEARRILVGGCSSSGTTLIRAILDSHTKIVCGPELCVFDRSFIYHTDFETFKILLANELALSRNILDANKTIELHKFDYLQHFLRLNSLDCSKSHFYPESALSGNLAYYVNDWASLVKTAKSSFSYKEFFDKLFLSRCSDSVEAWAEKSPRNIFYAREAIELFEDLKFIYVYRSPLDVICSLINRSFAKKALDQAICQFIRSYKSYRSVRECEAVFVVNYENLVENHIKCINDLMCFLDFDSEPDQLSFYEKHREVTSGYGEKPISSNSIGRWENELSKEQLDYIFASFKRDGLAFLLPSRW